jgi:hypothetical protein
VELHFVVGRGTAPRVEAFGLLNRVLIQKQRISKIRGELGEPIAPLFRVFNPSPTQTSALPKTEARLAAPLEERAFCIVFHDST